MAEERDNPARYLPIIESCLARIESGTNAPNSYNANTRKTNSKKLSDYIRRTQKSKKASQLATKRMAKATELTKRMKRLFRNDEESSIASEASHINMTLSPFTNYPPISYVSPPEEPADSLSIMLDTEETPKEEETQKKACLTLFDPCTKESLANLSELEKRVRELRQRTMEEIDERIELPSHIKTRLDLLVFVLNQPTSPTLSLLEYKRGGQTGQIFEAYWDIVFALGLVAKYPINNAFYMYNGNIDGIRSMDDSRLINNPLLYLQKRNINMGASGASDITIVYKATSENVISDPCSHTTLTTETKPKFIFCSSKFYKSDAQKGIDKFDLQNIYTSVKNLSTDYDYDIVLLVRNRKIVKDKIKSAIRQYIAEEASNVFGVDDLVHALTKIYNYVHDKKESMSSTITIDDLFAILGKEKPMKPILNLRLHQEIAVQKISNTIHRFNKHPGGNNKFLVGILPRGGKTYIAGGIVREIKPKRVVVLLGAMSETLDQFKADLFEYFQDFNEYTIVNVKKETTDFTIDESKKYIFLMSIELYKQEHSSRRLLIDLKSGASKADLFLCDEAHLKQVTARADIEMKKGTEVDDVNALLEVDTLISKAVPIVYMTGTYMRPLTAFKIPHKNVVIWDYQDLQNGKKLADNDTYFKELYGDLYTHALEKLFAYGETKESISNVYKKFPDLHLLTTQFTDEAKHAFSDQGLGKGFATIEQLFRLKKGFSIRSCSCPRDKRKDCKCPLDISTSHEWANGFQNLNGVLRLVNYLSPLSSQIKHINDVDIEPTGSVIRSIDKISQRMGDRLAHISTDFVVHTQIWFMAHSQSDLVENRMPALASAIFRNKWFRDNFVILGVYGKSDQIKQKHIKIKAIDETGSFGIFKYLHQRAKESGAIESLKESIIREENEARQSNKGLLILAQNMLQVGISLPCADVVVLLDTGENVDERIQKMFRALTESPMKRAGFIVDMNYFRTVKAIMDYQLTSLKVKKNKRIITSQDKSDEFNKFLDLYAIDDDKGVFKADIQATIPEIETLIQREGVGDIQLDDAGKHIDSNVKNILNSQYSKMYNEYFAKVEIEKEQARIMRQEGRDVGEAENENNALPNNSKPVVPAIFDTTLTENGKKESFLDIFKTILKMGIFTTNNLNIDELQTFIKDNTKFRDDVYDTLVKRGDIVVPLTQEKIAEQKAFLFNEIIIPNLQKIVASGRGDSYIAMKTQFDRSDDMNQKIDEVLTYINMHLAPKDKERHQHGEVFTPLSLVDEMLSKLPDDVWSNPDLKWLDPANGMGNFPIKVYLGQNEGEFKYPGLYEGLKTKIPDEKERCKHIIEKMLYMIDINGKNNAIARRLFEKLCPGARANIEQIDKKNGFLSDKPLAFNGKVVETFDVIIGNPPFNKGTILRKQTRKIKHDIKQLGLEDVKRESLWTQFILNIFTKNRLKDNGYLLFITPINWFHPEISGTRDIILSKQIHFIRIFSLYDSMKKFGGKGKLATAYYLIQNKNVNTNTEIIDILGNRDHIKLNKDSILILAYNSIYNKVIDKCSLFKDGDTLKSTTVKGCTPGHNKQIIGVYNDGLIKYVKTNVVHPLQTVPKIIINGYRFPRYFYDKDGEYGKYPKDGTNFIITGNKLNKVVTYLDTKLSALILNNIKFTQEKIEPKYYPDVRELPIDKITDQTLADYFGFTKEERDAIEATEYPKRKYEFKEITCAELRKETEPTEGGGSHTYNKTRKIRRTHI